MKTDSGAPDEALSRLEQLTEQLGEELLQLRRDKQELTEENGRLRAELEGLEARDEEPADWLEEKTRLAERVQQLVQGLDELVAEAEGDA